MRFRIDYRPAPFMTPLTPWVHRGVDAPFWRARVFEPARPAEIPGKGWPVWVAEHRGREIAFGSPEEMAHAIDILGRRILPRSRDLGRPHRAVNAHWLSRLHSTWKPWKVRRELVKRLAAAPPAT